MLIAASVAVIVTVPVPLLVTWPPFTPPTTLVLSVNTPFATPKVTVTVFDGTAGLPKTSTSLIEMPVMASELSSLSDFAAGKAFTGLSFTAVTVMFFGPRTVVIEPS